MTLVRPARGTLPFWSKMAIAELAGKGATYRELMELFGVSRSTVYRAIHRPYAGYCFLSAERQVTAIQAAPVASRKR